MKKGKAALAGIVGILVMAAPYSLAAPGGQPNSSGGDVGAANTALLKAFSTSADGGTLMRVSTHGNLYSFVSPNSTAAGRYDHIFGGTTEEGYLLCYTNPFTATFQTRYDMAFTETAWGATSSTLSPTTVTRNTSDNVLKLKQTFMPGLADKQMKIRMDVTNNTGVTVFNVFLRRGVDFDIDGAGTSGWSPFSNNWHGRTSIDSVFAFNSPDTAPGGFTAHAMTLRHVSTVPAGLSRQTWVGSVGNIIPTGCGFAGSAATPSQFDGAESIDYFLGSIPSGATRTVTVAYNRH